MTETKQVVEAQGVTEQQKKILNVVRVYFGEEPNDKFDEWHSVLYRQNQEFMLSDNPEIDTDKKRYYSDQNFEIIQFLDTIKLHLKEQ